MAVAAAVVTERRRAAPRPSRADTGAVHHQHNLLTARADILPEAAKVVVILTCSHEGKAKAWILGI